MVISRPSQSLCSVRRVVEWFRPFKTLHMVVCRIPVRRSSSHRHRFRCPQSSRILRRMAVFSRIFMSSTIKISYWVPFFIVFAMVPFVDGLYRFYLSLELPWRGLRRQKAILFAWIPAISPDPEKETRRIRNPEGPVGDFGCSGGTPWA